MQKRRQSRVRSARPQKRDRKFTARESAFVIAVSSPGGVDAIRMFLRDYGYPTVKINDADKSISIEQWDGVFLDITQGGQPDAALLKEELRDYYSNQMPSYKVVLLILEKLSTWRIRRHVMISTPNSENNYGDSKLSER